MTTPTGSAFCAACGSPLTQGLPTCSRCGRPVDAARVDVSESADPAVVVTADPSTASEDPGPTPAPTSGRGSRRRWIVAGAGAAVVAAAAVVTVLLVTGGSGSPSTPLDQRAKDARDVAAVLDTLAKDPGTVRAGGQELADVDARAAVPDGAKVVPDQKTWQPDGAGGGVMTVTLTAADGTTSTYLAVMVHEDTGWKVLQTFPAPAAASAPTGSPTAVAS